MKGMGFGEKEWEMAAEGRGWASRTAVARGEEWLIWEVADENEGWAGESWDVTGKGEEYGDWEVVGGSVG
ncbi:hypothetical protein GCM10009555_043230 [Acrocarpospora macrocephala]|uniref:Uncharacterized protein n=1 Tax=Acrocarpospora macrocephala TaxID=150177 RepID=A0A5M3X486_9ACTN|nr:hypothetical protein Amac_090690 [Acrocarpospora macrocephala]